VRAESAAQGRLLHLNMPGNRHKALQLLFRNISRGAGDPADDLIARLRKLQDARADVLTEEEYTAWRHRLLRQLVERVRMPLLWRITLAVCCLGLLGMIVYGIHRGGGGAVIGGAAGLIAGIFIWYGLERDYLDKRRLDRDARLEVIERLVQTQLVAEPEAAELRSKIRSAFAERPEQI
jgi:hypothetical protein